MDDQIINQKVPQIPLTPEAIQYTWRQLFQRVDFQLGNKLSTSQTGFESLRISPAYSDTEDRKDLEDPTIYVVPCENQDWYAQLERAPNTLEWLPSSECVPRGSSPPIQTPIPILFRGASCANGKKPFAEILPNGALVFYVDIIATTFFMLSRWEETISPTRDQYDRFPATASVAFKQGFLDMPIVDVYALILREWIRVLIPNWEPIKRTFSIKISHDIDFIKRFDEPISALRHLGGDIIKRRSISNSRETLKDFFHIWFSPEKNSFAQSIWKLADASSENHLDSAFYFMATSPTDPFDNSGYDQKTPWVKKIIENLEERGFEIGLHPSYETMNNFEILTQEKSLLEQNIKNKFMGGRQHYLRFKTPDTWLNWERAGMTYDSTIGYADYEGFRCGTCHPFHPFDINDGRELKLIEEPLIVMDSTLMKYREMTPDEAEAKIITLAKRCKNVEGRFTFLWHNTSLSDLSNPWDQMYLRVLKKLSNMVNSLEI
ncbi:polysaccharide deacetylase family protein [Chloroflexota bacterium]